MGKYILKRILIAIPTLIGITIIDYAIMCMAGNPLEMLQGARISQAAIEAQKAALGLDQPFYIQYFVWLSNLLQGNMGYSVKTYQSVSAMIGSHLGPTLLLMGVSLIVSLLMAVPAGIYSAIHQYSKGDYTVVTLSFFGSSIPGFFLSLLLVYLFTVKLGWLPSGGMTTLGSSGGAADIAAHMVMPVIVEQLFSWPGLGLMTMSAIMSRDYPVIMGVCLLSAVVVLAGNLITDILYAVVNPTIQYQ